MSVTIYKGDNLQAFDGSPIEVEFDTGGEEVSKAEFVINKGTIVKTFLNPESPIFVNLTEADTKKLSLNNYAKLVLYDSQGRRKTCDETLTFTVKDGI